MIIGSIVLTTKESFFQTSFALMLIGAMTFLEYSGIVNHYPLEGFIISNMYNNLTYLVCTGIVFVSTSYFVVYVIRTIVKESNKHEIAYLQANIKLKQKDIIKNEYVMRITHDIKGHITAIHSCINVLRKQLTGPLNPQQAEFVNRAHTRIETLNKFILALLSITKIKLQHRQDNKYFSIANSVKEIQKIIENSALEKNIDLKVSIEPTVSTIYGEQSSIEEVLINLIQNAIKYSPSGKSVSINVIDKNDQIQIDVIDNGLGIPKEEQKLIFNEFYRASNIKNLIKDGTGLGLALSKKIVENHGGRIWVESIVNIGSTFSILLKKEK